MDCFVATLLAMTLGQMPRKPPSGLPTAKQILDFITTSGQPAGKREIARAFGLSGQTRSC